MEGKKVLIIAHGDLDGVISAVGIARTEKISAEQLEIIFCQPFTVDKIKIPDHIKEIYVVDIAVNNRDVEMTRKFIEENYQRIVRWYDHHQGWPVEITGDGSAVFVVWEAAKSCAELIAGSDSELVADAIAADTRKGELSLRGQLIEQATKANMADDSIRVAAVKWLLGDESKKTVLEAAAEKYAVIQKETQRLAATYEVDGKVAIVDARQSNHEYDLTQLLLAGQKLAEFAVVKVLDPIKKQDRITIATQSGRDLVKLFVLPSGSPSRVSLEVTRLPEVLEKLQN